MAEIKSTMDMVMERAAKMAAGTPPTTNNEEQVKSGMRLAADYLNQKLTDLAGKLAAQQPEVQSAVRSGMLQTLLRNITLPRDEALRERSILALQGVQAITQYAGVSSVTGVCTELQQILDQYSRHKEQMTQQLEDALRGQLEQQYAARGSKPGNLNAAMHPQYHDELAKMLGDLNGQYNQAMDQRKEMISRELTQLQ